MEKITMYDNRLSVNVDVYKIGQPDQFGAHVLAYYKGDGKLSAYAENQSLSAHLNELSAASWYTTSIRHLVPSS